MMKAKKVLKTTLAAVMAATTITAVAVPASADNCEGWEPNGVKSAYCDYTSGWCYWNDSRHSHLQNVEYKRKCTENGQTKYQYTYEKVKDGCCS